MPRDQHLVIKDYNPQWKEMFQEEKQRLSSAIGDYVEFIKHIGSTAVEGLAAKPVIDIMIGVRNLAQADSIVVPAIVDLGYEYIQDVENLMPNRRYFRRSDDSGMRTHQIHMWQINHADVERHLAFRDYLRAHPAEAAAYEKFKRELVEQFDDANEYADAKSEFIKPAEQRALEWKASQQE